MSQLEVRNAKPVQRVGLRHTCRVAEGGDRWQPPVLSVHWESRRKASKET